MAAVVTMAEVQACTAVGRGKGMGGSRGWHWARAAEASLCGAGTHERLLPVADRAVSPVAPSHNRCSFAVAFLLIAHCAKAVDCAPRDPLLARPKKKPHSRWGEPARLASWLALQARHSTSAMNWVQELRVARPQTRCKGRKFKSRELGWPRSIRAAGAGAGPRGKQWRSDGSLDVYCAAGCSARDGLSGCQP
jgi:hypothetical protein